MKLILYKTLAIIIALMSIGFVEGCHNKKCKQHKPELMKKTINYSAYGALDVYYDNSLKKKRRPVVVYVHGGGWCEGSKEKEKYMGEFFQNNDYVSVMVDYRLYPETESIDDMVDDIYHALKWTTKHIREYGGNKNEITLIGHSAGAHLATLTIVKAALRIRINRHSLSPIHIKHLISLNGRHKIDEGDELLAGIEQLKQLGNIPGLSFLGLYGEAREHLLVGKDGYDQSKILKSYGDKSILSLGAEKYTFVECDEDNVDPLGLSEPMIEQLKRTVRRVTIDHKIYHGGHSYILDGIQNKDAEIEQELLNMVESIY